MRRTLRDSRSWSTSSDVTESGTVMDVMWEHSVNGSRPASTTPSRMVKSPSMVDGTFTRTVMSLLYRTPPSETNAGLFGETSIHARSAHLYRTPFMLVTPSGTVNSVMPESPKQAYPSLVTESGMPTESREVHPSKTQVPMLVSPSGNSTWVRREHPQNAPSSTVLTGMSMVRDPEMPWGHLMRIVLS